MPIDPAIQERAREKAEKQDIPFRKALLWTKPYDLDARTEHLKSLPEYAVVDLQVGGIIGVEDKNG